MPQLAHWASDWAQKAIKCSTSSPRFNLGVHRLLRAALLEHSTQIANITSCAFLTYSRIVCGLCLYRAETKEIRPEENWQLLKTLATLFQLDTGYSSALMHHIISLLKSQPNSAKEDRNRLLIAFGRFFRDSSISPSECSQILKLCMSAIPKNLIDTPSKEMMETGHMWARIAQKKIDQIPQNFIPEIQRALDAISLPTILSSKNAVSACTSLVDIAFRLIVALESEKRKTMPLRASLLRIYSHLTCNLNAIRKVQSIDTLECTLMRALSAISFEKIFPTITSVLEDATGNSSNNLKKEALKCLFRRMIQNPEDETLRKTLWTSARQFLLDCGLQSPLRPLCSQIVTYARYCDVTLCLPLPMITEPNDAGPDFVGFSSSLFSLRTLRDDFHISPLKTLTITCRADNAGCGEDTTAIDGENDFGPTSVSSFSDFFDSMTNFENELETLNRYPMSVLTQIEKLADFPDQQDSAFLGSLQETLLHQLQNPEEGTHNGLLAWVSTFHARPVAQKELILCVLRAPTLLSNPLFLYHLSRVSLGFQVASASISMFYAQQYAHASQMALSTNPQPFDSSNSTDLDTSKDEQENLKKRKEMALKMIDDLEFTEGNAQKRFSPGLVSQAPSIPDKSSHMDVDSVNLENNGDQSAKRTTRSQAKKAKAASSVSASSPQKSSNKSSKRTSASVSADQIEGEKALEHSSVSSVASDLSPTKSDKKKSKLTASSKKTAKAPRKREICKLWQQHRCYKGDDCPYLHEGAQLTFDTICKFHRTGNCTKGSACPYSHDLKSEACNNLVSTGNCKFGDRCAYSHEASKVEMAKSQAEARRRQEEEEEQKISKESQLPFAQHIVPILFQPDYMRPNQSFGYTEEITQDEHDGQTGTQESRIDTGTSAPEVPSTTQNITHAYVPPTLASLSIDSTAHIKRTAISIAPLPTAVPLPLTSPTLIPLAPPKPLTDDSMP